MSNNDNRNESEYNDYSSEDTNMHRHKGSKSSKKKSKTSKSRRSSHSNNNNMNHTTDDDYQPNKKIRVSSSKKLTTRNSQKKGRKRGMREAGIDMTPNVRSSNASGGAPSNKKRRKNGIQNRRASIASPQTKRVKLLNSLTSPAPLEYSCEQVSDVTVKDVTRHLLIGQTTKRGLKRIAENIGDESGSSSNKTKEEIEKDRNNNNNSNNSNEVAGLDAIGENRVVSFRFRVKHTRDPIKDALKRIGTKTFSMKDLIGELEEIVDYQLRCSNQQAKKKLNEKLVAHTGVTMTNQEQQFNGISTEYNAVDFLTV